MKKILIVRKRNENNEVKPFFLYQIYRKHRFILIEQFFKLKIKNNTHHIKTM